MTVAMQKYRLRSGVLRPRTAAIVVALALSLVSIAGGRELPVQDWKIGPGVRVIDHDGVKALEIVSGSASFGGIEVRDGTVELEMMLGSGRAFSYLKFRVDETGRNHEELYFRNHKSLAPDALQYTPVDRGMSAWQLYHGEGKTAPVELPTERWIPVKLVVEGHHAAVFVGETGEGAEPVLVVRRLARSPMAGGIGLRGFVPRGSSAPYAVRYRGVRVEEGRVDYDFSGTVAPDSAPEGTIAAWRLAPSFVAGALTVESLEEVPAASRRESVTARPDAEGLVNIGKLIERPEEGRPWAAVAGVTLEAESAGTARLDLGYSDAVSVFLDGELLFSADDSYSYDQPRRQGLIGLFQASMYLPLEKGENELEIVVADGFGGWGLMGRLVADGVRTRP